MIVRNTHFKNVAKGPFWNSGWLSDGATLTKLERTGADNKTALAETASDTGVQVGERVKIEGSGATPAEFKGVFKITEVLPANKQFKYQMISAPSQNAPNNDATVKKVFGASRIVVERNTVELAQGSAGLAAIHVHDNNLTAQEPAHVHGDVIIRDNQIRYVGGAYESGYTGFGAQVNGAQNVIVRNNVLECAPLNPLRNARESAATYSNNRTPGGVLVQGWNSETGRKYDEPETEAEDAFILAYLER